VEEYKRPTFEVKLDKPASQFRLGDSVTITGKAIGYNGIPVAGAKVKISYQPVPAMVLLVDALSTTQNHRFWDRLLPMAMERLPSVINWNRASKK
jgi:uncharacterized protein YfaS (alpha-2-macroglobulin family)